MSEPFLTINNLTKVYENGLLNKGKSVVALRNFNLEISNDPPTITTIAGESGSGKTTLARLMLGFISATEGNIQFKGQSIDTFNTRERVEFYRDVQAVFQDPFETYNPFYSVDHVLYTPIKKFGLTSNRTEARDLIERALIQVGLQPEDILGNYPHQLSGGQRQRIIVARALLLHPSLIVADEPVSMLDASLRANVLNLMLDLKEEYNISFVYISHDLSTAYQISDDIFILYKGWVVEHGDAEKVIGNPYSPYARLLVSSIPRPNPENRWKERLENIPEEEGMRTETGCLFYDNCSVSNKFCRNNMPETVEIEENHYVCCHLYRG